MRTKVQLLIVAALAVAPASSLLAQRSAGMEREPLHAFGRSSANAQGIGSLFEEDFFSTSLMGSVANRENYTAIYTVPQRVSEGQYIAGAREDKRLTPRPVARPTVLLDLTNEADQTNQIIVSAVVSRTGATRNHLVPLEPGATARIEASELGDFDRLYILSMQAFSGQVESRAEGRSIDRRVLEILTPRNDLQAEISAPFKGSSLFCADISLMIDVCVSGTSDCVVAWAKRRFAISLLSTDFYRLDVEFPRGTPFHVFSGVAVLGSGPECKMTVYRTQRTDPLRSLRWDGTDDTLFNCATSTATCTRGCNDPGVPADFDVTCH